MSTQGISEIIGSSIDDYVAIRRDLHAHPELKYSEYRTASVVRHKLSELGIPVVADLAGTGLVAALRRGTSAKSLGLRADMDALAIEETSGRPYSSSVPGVMHACGHDGHVATLLCAADYLARYSKFDGTVYFVFQPAEEGGAGAKRMIEDGLFERCPMDAIYALHNWPGLPSGDIAVSEGGVMASTNDFEITLEGPGGHVAFPHRSADLVGLACHMIERIRRIRLERIDPMNPITLAVTTFDGGTTVNAFPTQVRLRGTVRAFDTSVVDRVESGIELLVRAAAHEPNVTASLIFERKYPATLNWAAGVGAVRQAAVETVGADRVHRQTPAMTSEDFAFMLEEVEGAYFFLGNGDGGKESKPLHSTTYDFDDDALPTGAIVLARLVEQQLAPQT
ncbi:amidohydrolase [Rhodococcus sp. IEGM 1318]|uniref:amidohydrolase n=1 Tax=Rhodococcus sp. IEGM 1318 TaxID=3082226 RepID=UPI0029555FF3|nr:amidohydrolase [Rhodococcus sp. IEGM 1318]MDV8009501.1 amidohydrolase [Rhodococcus sp. IEGM 1318]